MIMPCLHSRLLTAQRRLWNCFVLNWPLNPKPLFVAYLALIKIHRAILVDKPCSWRFLGIIGRDSSVSKTNRLHVAIFRFFFVLFFFMLETNGQQSQRQMHKNQENMSTPRGGGMPWMWKSNNKWPHQGQPTEPAESRTTPTLPAKDNLQTPQAALNTIVLGYLPTLLFPLPLNV